jgi:HK97 family phage major capsid protein
MTKSQELRKQAESLYRNIKDLYSKKELTEEDNQKFDQWNTDYDKLMADATRFESFEQKEIQEERSIEVHNQITGKKLTPEDVKERENLAMKEYVLTGRVSEGLREYMKPLKKESDDSSMIDAEFKRMGLVRANAQSTTDGSGGYTIPRGFQAELEIAMKAFGGMLQASRIWRTSTGNTVDWPKVNDTGNRAYLLNEASNAETSAVKITDADQQFEAYKITSGLLRVSSELVQDSAFNIVQVVNDFLAERMGRGVNYYTTVADGSSKPKGIVVGASHGNNTADDQVLAVADFLNLEHKVDPAYRIGASWMFHDSVLKEIKRVSLAATVGYPLWVPSFRDGAPATILNYPYFINQDMASFTQGSASANDNAKIALFGNFQKYVIRFAGDLRFVRLNERFGDTDEIGLVAFQRIDGDLLDAGTHPVKYMRVSAT